jgi:uncharacterized secreted protein with C-terminal beta-propeller domain
MKFSLANFFRKSEMQNVVAVNADATDYTQNDHEFRFVFNDPVHTEKDGCLISFGNLQECKLSETLTIYQNEKPSVKLDFHYKYASSRTQLAIKFNRFVAVGFSGYFFLYDLSTGTVVLFIDFRGYFNDFETYNGHLFVTYNAGIYCLTNYGVIKWHNSNVGIDGVLITEVKEDKVYGSEQIDPPDGWKDFILDLETGQRSS